MSLGMEVGFSPGHIVLDRDPAPPLKRGTASHFLAHVYCGQTAGWMPFGTVVDLGPGNIVFDADPAPLPPQVAEPPPFSAHVCRGQTAGWIKMPLSTKVGLGPGHIVLHGDPASLGAQPPPQFFGPCLLWANGRLSQLLLSTCIS